MGELTLTDPISSHEADRPEIFEYLDYRIYLRDTYKFNKIKTKGRFSFRSFAKKAALSSPNYLKLVMDGNRHLSHSTIEKFCRALNLNGKETSFFNDLVYYCKARTANDKERYFIRLKKYKKFLLAQNIGDKEDNYYSHWYVPVIREMVLLKKFRADPIWISRQITPNITVQEARDALALLLKLGLLVINDEGRLVQNDPVVATDFESSSSFVWEFQKTMLHKAYQSIFKSPVERNISGVTVSLSKKQYEDIMIMTQDFYTRIQEYLNHNVEPADMVAQINVQQFKLTRETLS